MLYSPQQAKEMRMADVTRVWQSVLVVLIVFVPATCGVAAERSAPAPPPEQPQVKATGQLRTQVDKLLAGGDPVMIRRSVGDVFALVDRLVKSGQQNDALEYLSAALTYDSWALDYQMLYAEMLRTRGQSDLARQRAELVLRYAEKDQKVNRARKLLQQDPLPGFPVLVAVRADETTLVLVPVGNVDVCALRELQQVLHARLTIPVLLRDAYVAVPPSKRDPVARYVAELRGRLQNAMKADDRLVMFLKQKGISPADLERDAEVVRACRQIALASSGDDLAQFDIVMDQLRKADRQWDISDLLDSLTIAVRPVGQAQVYFLGVANLDAFAEQSNYIFGTAQTGGHHAVITYRRFTADFNHDTPNRKRLVDRMLKQSLSSIGFMLGVPRCSTPTCARAYPHTLVEHDAKSTDLCDACRLGFERALGIELPRNGEDLQPTLMQR
jgi:predicted Zn-dependent protease